MSIALLRFLPLPIVIATLALAGCSTNKMIVSEWSNPGYASSSFRTIMVGGLGGQSSIGRNFEDEFVTQLKAAGVDALPSYRYIPDHEKVDEAGLKEAARPASAAIMSTPQRSSCTIYRKMKWSGRERSRPLSRKRPAPWSRTMSRLS